MESMDGVLQKIRKKYLRAKSKEKGRKSGRSEVAGSATRYEIRVRK
jgi:hypothetical protein